MNTNAAEGRWLCGIQGHIQQKVVAGTGKKKGLSVGLAICLISMWKNQIKKMTKWDYVCLVVGLKSHLKGMETSYVGMPEKPLWVNTETNGDGYCSPRLPFKILSDLFRHYQYYLVNK